jgi:hypothetical protein
MATEKELLEIDAMAREHIAAGLADGSIPPMPRDAIELAIRLGVPRPRRAAKAAS